MTEQLRQWIADYDSGKAMESVEMGGISEGYEVAIQECAIETIRNLQMIALPEDKEAFRAAVQVAADAAVDLLNDEFGFSGAQVGAAKNLAAVFWRQTPAIEIAKMKEQDPKRVITISKGENGKVCVGKKYFTTR